MDNRLQNGFELKQVALRRGHTQVFDGLTLHLHERRIGLIGANGAGKSSLLRLLCALEIPEAGQLTLGGQPLGAAPDGRVGLMFQNPDDQIIFPTVAEELALAWRGAQSKDALAALGRRGARDAADAAVAAFLAARGLNAWADRAVTALSQGQRQMLCWLATLLAAPQVVLLDEPFASLDLLGQRRLQKEMNHVGQQLIISTHILDAIVDFERVIWLHQGKIQADGPGHMICAEYEKWARGLSI